MNEETMKEDIQFDRLVDGELTCEERQRLLESLDGRPDGWRRCALAFLEAQSFGEGLGEIVRPSAKKFDETIVSTRDSANGRSNRGTGPRWLALAASVMFAFILGLMQRDRMAPVAGEPAVTNGQIATVDPPSPPSRNDAKAVDDAITLLVRDDTGKVRPLRVPLVDADPLDQRLGTQFQSGVPAEIRNRLQDRGYHVQSKRRYAPLMLENGRPMFLPVEDTQIMPVKQNVY
jgi:hypothetical protein